MYVFLYVPTYIAVHNTDDIQLRCNVILAVFSSFFLWYFRCILLCFSQWSAVQWGRGWACQGVGHEFWTGSDVTGWRE